MNEIDPERRALAHTEHVTVIDALAANCVDGECEHVDENGMPDDYSACPRVVVEVCVDCMEARGDGRDPVWWESLAMWPCTAHVPPLVQHGPELMPPIFKPAFHPTGRE